MAASELTLQGSIAASNTLHRPIESRIDVIESSDGKLSQLAKPVHGFKSMKTAYAAFTGFAAPRKGKAGAWQYGGGIMEQVHLIERQFGVCTG